MISNLPPNRRLAAIVVIAALMPSGCGYGPVSDTSYQYAKALYALSNRQSTDRVDAVQAQIDATEEAGELPPREAKWLRDICAQCRDGNWDAAQANARRMMTDQLKY